MFHYNIYSIFTDPDLRLGLLSKMPFYQNIDGISERFSSSSHLQPRDFIKYLTSRIIIPLNYEITEIGTLWLISKNNESTNIPINHISLENWDVLENKPKDVIKYEYLLYFTGNETYLGHLLNTGWSYNNNIISNYLQISTTENPITLYKSLQKIVHYHNPNAFFFKTRLILMVQYKNKTHMVNNFNLEESLKQIV